LLLLGSSVHIWIEHPEAGKTPRHVTIWGLIGRLVVEGLLCSHIGHSDTHTEWHLLSALSTGHVLVPHHELVHLGNGR
jgi:hypothetical protein